MASLLGGVVSGFCHFGLVYSWFCDRALILPSCPRFHVSAAASSVLESRASRLRALFHVGAWCLDTGTHVLSFGHVTGFGHSRSHFLSLCGVRGLEFALAPRTLVHVCFVVLHAVCVSIGCVHYVVMSCVNTWLMSFLIGCVFMSCFAHGW